MAKTTDICVTGATLYFLPVQTRLPLKFGAETLTSVTCARVCVQVRDRAGRSAEGWGETPLSVQWAWPGRRTIEERHRVMKQFCGQLAGAWARFGEWGHPLELGTDFCAQVLPRELEQLNAPPDPGGEPMPWLAALICCSAFDLAVHDAYGILHDRPVYETYDGQFMNRTLADFMTADDDHAGALRGRFPKDIFLRDDVKELYAWHLVGGLDLLEPSELTGTEPRDGHPVVLTDWIQADGLRALKVKLRGTDARWDLERLQRVGRIALASGVEWLTADFNCTVTDPEYVNAILDQLGRDAPRVHEMIAYVEQPFPYELETHRIDVRSLAARKPLYLDESAHDWRMVQLGRRLGWTGVALKTCKTQTGAVLSGCWAKTHGMGVMVQDLTNPMLAQIPHVLLAARVGTLFGVETNGMQFYPEASRWEAEVHPGLYRRREGKVHLASVHGAGFGYRLNEIKRELPEGMKYPRTQTPVDPG